MNLFNQFKALLPGGVQDVGQILSVETDGVIVQLVSGAQIHARGTGDEGAWVYLEDGVVTGPAPALSGHDIEV